MMRIRPDIDDRLLKKAKALAARKRISLSQLAEEGLVLRLSTLRPSQKRLENRAKT